MFINYRIRKFSVSKNGKNEDFRRGLHNLMREVAQAKKDGQEAEVFIYYSGHGIPAVKNLDQLFKYLEGEAEGLVRTADGLMSETDFNKMVERHLPEVKTMIILDSCHSGSWVA